jgi:hypothetical protein
VAVAGVGMARSQPGPAFAPATGTCYAVTLYENANGGGDNWLRLCVNIYERIEASNLGNYAVTNGDRLCTKGFGNSTNWNDCAGSVHVYIGSGQCSDGRKDTGGNGEQLYYVRGPANTLVNILSDTMSSFYVWPC